MGFFNNFPYTNFHELNLDWVVRITRKNSETVSNMNILVEKNRDDIDSINEKLENFGVFVEPAVKKEIDRLISDGTFSAILGENYTFVTPQLYGAVADGVEDCSEQINRCLTENVGNVVFFPKGVYRISSPIIIPKKSVIVGSGTNTIIKPDSGIDAMKTENYEYLIANPPSAYTGSYYLRDFYIDGGLFTNLDTFTKSERRNGSGIKIYGNNFQMVNVWAINCAEVGCEITNVKNHTEKESSGLWVETKIERCVFGFNGKDGLKVSNLFDFSLVDCCAHTNGQNDNEYFNKYANVRLINSSCKANNCHFSSLYGPVKPYYSLLTDSGMVNISNSHVEGAYIPLKSKGLICATNCYFYGSFGVCDIEISSSYSTFEGCFLGRQIADETANVPQWVGALKFLEGCRNNKFDVTLLGTELYTNDDLMGYLNEFNVRGYCVGKPVVNRADSDRASFNFIGDFEAPYNNRAIRNSATFFAAGGLPGVDGANIVNYELNGDIVNYNKFLVIKGYLNGTVTHLPHLAPKGSISVVVNNSERDIPWITTGNYYINGVQSGSFPKKSVSIMIATDEYNYIGLA